MSRSEKGDYLGTSEMVLTSTASPSARMSTAVCASSECKLLSVNRDLFSLLIEALPSLSSTMADIVQEEIQTVVDTYFEKNRHKCKTKVYNASDVIWTPSADESRIFCVESGEVTVEFYDKSRDEVQTRSIKEGRE